MKRVLILSVLILLLLFIVSCDTITSVKPYGVWRFYDNESGADYEQTLQINEDGSYSWTWLKNAAVDPVLSSNGTWVIESDRSSKTIIFTWQGLIDPEGPADGEVETKTIKYNFMIKDDGFSLVLGEQLEGRWVGRTYSLSIFGGDEV